MPVTIVQSNCSIGRCFFYYQADIAVRALRLEGT